MRHRENKVYETKNEKEREMEMEFRWSGGGQTQWASHYSAYIL